MNHSLERVFFLRMAFLYTILVADDDPVLLEIVAKVLEEPGYTVLTASDGYEAVRVLADRHVDLLITDVRMPGLSGFELAQQAKLLRPNLHIVYMSGYYSEKKEGCVLSYGVFLQKPVRADALLATIRQELVAR